MPVRIQLRRVKGWRMPKGAVSVSRPSQWGNPYHIGGKVWNEGVPHTMSAAEAVEMYRDWITPYADFVRAGLRGKDLACWCPLTDEHGNHMPCHADVLLELANR